MMTTTTGQLIRKLRTERGLTQAVLAEQLHISDKTISKWERDAGLPDVTLLPALAAALGVPADTLLAGGCEPNQRDAGSMRRIRFFRCPVCGGVMNGTAQAQVSCCGRALPPMKAKPFDDEHRPAVTPVEDELLLTFAHPMSKAHHIVFVALVSPDRLHLVRLFPEGAAELRVPRIPYARVYAVCSADGLWCGAL